MASVETLEKRINSKEKAIEKLQKKLDRIEKAKASNWVQNPYYYGERDLKYTLRDLQQAQEDLENYEAALKVAKEKEASRNVKVILDFLEVWKARVFEHYQKSVEQYIPLREEFYQKRKAYREQEQKYFRENHIRTWKDENRFWDNAPEWAIEYKEYETAFIDKWKFLQEYLIGEKLDTEKLQRDLIREANNKYDDIINRTNKIVGTIQDASNLHIGLKGDMEGYIVGDRGKATVQTIGAGGYNIQCYHFRTLVNEKK